MLREWGHSVIRQEADQLLVSAVDDYPDLIIPTVEDHSRSADPVVRGGAVGIFKVLAALDALRRGDCDGWVVHGGVQRAEGVGEVSLRPTTAFAIFVLLRVSFFGLYVLAGKLCEWRRQSRTSFS